MSCTEWHYNREAKISLRNTPYSVSKLLAQPDVWTLLQHTHVEKWPYLVESLCIPSATWKEALSEGNSDRSAKIRKTTVHSGVHKVTPLELIFRPWRRPKSTTSCEIHKHCIAEVGVNNQKQICGSRLQFTGFCVGLLLFRSRAHRAALALWGFCGLAIPYILTNHVLTQHRPFVT